MSLVSVWLRLEARRRARSLAVLALLVAVATTTVLAALAGARRGDSAMARLNAVTLPADAVVLPNQPGFDWDAVRALPGVAAVSGFAVAPFFVEELPGYFGYLPPVDREAFRTVERPVVLEGRLADPARPDEVMVTGYFPGAYGLGVGDTLTLRLLSERQAGDFIFSGEPGGPRVRARIVGVIRSPWYSDKLADKGAWFSVFPSPALFAAHPKNFLGPSSSGFVNALVRLDQGERGLPAFRAGLAKITGRTDIEIWNAADVARHRQQVNAYESLCLVFFALAALAAAIVLVGQSVARYVAAGVGELQVLRASGLTTRQCLAAVCAGPFLASVAGSTLGTAGAAAASMWTPIGAASLVEPAPGFSADPLVLGCGWAAAPLLVLAGALAAAWLAVVSARSEAAPVRSVVARAADRLGLPVPLVAGARFALERGQGASSVPVRPALVAAVAGVLGVLASFTFAAGVADAAGNPTRFGQTFQLTAYLGESGEDWAAAEQVMTAAARDPDVAGVNDARVAVAEAGGVSVTVYRHQSFAGSADVVLLSGRMPEGPGEVVLAPTTARSLRAEVGSSVRLAGTTGPREMTVRGIGFVPQGSHNDYDAGAWATADGFEAMFGAAFKYHLALVALRPGADPQAVLDRLTKGMAGIGGGDRISVEAMQPPEQLAEVQDVQILPLFLGGFLALLAVGAVGHALATAVRRRRHEVAVMRALGMTRAQSRLVVFTQASLLAVAGLAFGVPLGVALGRTLWRVVAERTPLFYEPPVALWALLAIGPAAVLIANLLALWPGRHAARLRIGHILRTE
ncbi:ABC transporter permease [Microbispora sp. SCL1-1]|uniref:ABC transporter permease n=1 Tax=Microbispora TaxID=2005 RepID=UPI001159986F|nr:MULTISPECIES: ABC transporter permease [unclassified Microbispora]NJP22921.1 ABC transporter permease [Microbispora sp. CL1-1]TQS16946.1 ABC transporter permease [Microbispora sp. SCL1-1]